MFGETLTEVSGLQPRQRSCAHSVEESISCFNFLVLFSSQDYTILVYETTFHDRRMDIGQEAAKSAAAGHGEKAADTE